MSFSFPSNPTVNQTSTQNGRVYTWSGYAWELLGNLSGGGGGSATTNASDLTSGTLNDARLSGNVVLTGDARLSDSRTPTSHASSHASAGSDPLTLSANQVSGLATVATSGSYDDLSNKPTIPAATTNASDLTSGTLSDSRLSANVVLTGDARLSDARTPTAHKSTHATGGTDALSASDIGAAASAHTHGNITNAGAIGTTADLPIITTTSGVLTTGTFGSAAGSFCQGDDSRLSNSRTPTTHASTHFVGGSDVITPANIGAAVQADLLNLFSLQTTAIDTLPRLWATGNPTLTSGSMILCFFTPLVTRTISQITVQTGPTTVASGLTLARMALYTYDDAAPLGTLVAATASDTTLFTATNTAYTRSLSTGGGLPSTYTLNAGSRYAFGLLCTGTTMPQILSQASNAGFIYAFVPRISGQRTSQTDLPASFTTLSTAGAVPYARLS